MSRLRSVDPIQSILTQGLVDTLIDAFLAVTALIVMALISVPLMPVVVTATVLILLSRLAIYPVVRRRIEEQILADASEDSFLMETMRSMRAIKLHAPENLRQNGWRNRYADVISASYRSKICSIWTRFAEGLIGSGQFLIVVYVAASAVVVNEMTIGTLLAFLAFRSSFTEAATAMLDHMEKWCLLSVHLERLSDIVTERREEIAVAPPRRNRQSAPSIGAEGVRFRYGRQEPDVLDDLSFHIPAGSFVAIIDESGAGKSTPTRLLFGPMLPCSGKLLVNGQPLTAATLGQWRSPISAVMQEDQLQSGTLADNIFFVEDQPDQSRIEIAARMARIHDTTIAMPMGYHSLVGDMGAALSAGQRQRTMRARSTGRPTPFSSTKAPPISTKRMRMGSPICWRGSP